MTDECNEEEIADIDQTKYDGMSELYSARAVTINYTVHWCAVVKLKKYVFILNIKQYLY